MFIGIDIGTSGVKVILMDITGQVVATQTESLTVDRPNPLWSEQNPIDWWKATDLAITEISKQHDLSQVTALGLTGQMHGAVLLDEQGEVLRPAILWNDGRSFKECEDLEKQVNDIHYITGNLIMPGFTAPKLIWVAKHEPEIFNKIAKVLLPKDYIRYCLTGEYASDMSDAAGTMWLDVSKRDWSDEVLSACDLNRSHMPKLYEGTEISGYLKKEIAQRWNMPVIPVVAGASDNSAGAIGVGLIKPGQAMLSLGTSGVYFVVSDGFLANPTSAVHSFCHSLPGTWHLMSVILSAASCVDWIRQLTGFNSVKELLDEVSNEKSSSDSVYFLPYLSGERTPHNNPLAKGVFFGMTHNTTRASLGRAVLEGVGFAFADSIKALEQTGLIPNEICLIGGGARSEFWRQMLADIFQRTLTYRKGGEVGPALGAARLAQLAFTDLNHIQDVCPVPELVSVHYPDQSTSEYYSHRLVKWRQLYESVKPLFD